MKQSVTYSDIMLILQNYRILMTYFKSTSSDWWVYSHSLCDTFHFEF